MTRPTLEEATQSTTDAPPPLRMADPSPAHRWPRALQSAQPAWERPQAKLTSIELARRVEEETAKFLRDQPYDETPALELMRRAISGEDDCAFTLFYQQYAPLVFAWVKQHQSAAALLGQDGSGPLVNAAFAKFWHALKPPKEADFATMAAVLKYLKDCTHSVVADAVRTRSSHAAEQALQEITALEQEPACDDPADLAVERLTAQALWQAVLEEVEEDERRLLELFFLYDLKPADIIARYPKLFPKVDDVYRVKRNVLERLRRNRRLRGLFNLAYDDRGPAKDSARKGRVAQRGCH